MFNGKIADRIFISRSVIEKTFVKLKDRGTFSAYAEVDRLLSGKNHVPDRIIENAGQLLCCARRLPKYDYILRAVF